MPLKLGEKALVPDGREVTLFARLVILEGRVQSVTLADEFPPFFGDVHALASDTSGHYEIDDDAGTPYTGIMYFGRSPQLWGRWTPEELRNA